jgi:hypothetical protein
MILLAKVAMAADGVASREIFALYPANVLTIQYPEIIRMVTNAPAARLAIVRCR